ncbi:class II histone deacetylase [Rhodosalinus sp. FB01]|uniref:class II histone deacetylase n=1 Tax=Rhodosalinus sp. FB01 TaxID=3239194 RepID=UPI00352384C0
MAIGLATHELFYWYEHGSSALFGRRPGVEPHLHVDTPDAKRRVRGLFEVSGLMAHCVALKPAEAVVSALTGVHDPAYVARVLALSEGPGGDAARGAWVPQEGARIVRLAAGAAMAAADAVLDGQVETAYALTRPAGHHAERAGGMGFCIFNNVALAARHALQRADVARVAIVDWDVHHGNGAQEIFYSDPNVLTISLHQDGLFPLDTGHLRETGAGDGTGLNINVPLPAGSGHDAYVAAVTEVVVPALEAFAPDLVILASGYDACVFDPLGRMLAHMETYRCMTEAIKAVADSVCCGRVVAVHEGGYSPVYAPYCALAVAEALSGTWTGVADPFAEVAGYPDQRMKPEQRAVIDAAAALAAALRGE